MVSYLHDAQPLPTPLARADQQEVRAADFAIPARVRQVVELVIAIHTVEARFLRGDAISFWFVATLLFRWRRKGRWAQCVFETRRHWSFSFHAHGGLGGDVQTRTTMARM